MEITGVKITLVSEENLKAYVSITLDDCFVVHDLKIIGTKDKMFVAMPSKFDKNKKVFRDIAHPVNPDCRQKIQDEVFKHYHETLQNFKIPAQVAGNQSS